ncbi:hypothetical protein H1Q78_01250 [Cellulosimicrobium cellulans]|uniref:hypothetical protein n=1 Tax=Cellulosimicrobium cellulans TaxID=1710 RepID=UPI001EDB1A10|nr:hypothetical protein [Cellulosimicrobium cellulans]UKJ64140.1 hypothetical protein H1Q78_01250 [Cellulosimicrobium cellulans]
MLAAERPPVEALHVGAHDALALTYARMDEWARARDLRPLDELWDLYETGRGSDPDPATWRTRVIMGVTSSDVRAGGPTASTA